MKRKVELIRIAMLLLEGSLTIDKLLDNLFLPIYSNTCNFYFSVFLGVVSTILIHKTLAETNLRDGKGELLAGGKS